MTNRIRRVRGQPDPHRRIEAWLADGAQEVLPRDVLVHASLCADCRLRIAAMDLLAMVELDQAGPPPPQPAADVREGARAGRVAMAAGGAVAVSAAVVVGAAATGWRPLGGGGVAVTQTEQPTQAVLGNTGQPTPSRGSSPTTSASTGATASADPSASDQPPFTFPPTALPTIGLPTPGPTQRASPRPGATPTPRPTAVPTPVPTAVPTPEPPTPTPIPDTPTPEPTPEERPVGP